MVGIPLGTWAVVDEWAQDSASYCVGGCARDSGGCCIVGTLLQSWLLMREWIWDLASCCVSLRSVHVEVVVASQCLFHPSQFVQPEPLTVADRLGYYFHLPRFRLVKAVHDACIPQHLSGNYGQCHRMIKYMLSHTKVGSPICNHRFFCFGVAHWIMHRPCRTGGSPWPINMHANRTGNQPVVETRQHSTNLRTSISPFLSAIGPTIQIDTAACIWRAIASATG